MNPTLILTAATLCAMATVQAAEPSLVELANPLQGTDSTGGFSHGNTYPAIALPFPMNAWAPYTQPAKDSFFYQYRQDKIRGIRQTHQPSPWIADYANFSLMPVSGKLAVKEDDRASDFRHETEIAHPSYYSVRLDTWKATDGSHPDRARGEFPLHLRGSRRSLRGARRLRTTTRRWKSFPPRTRSSASAATTTAACPRISPTTS